MKNMMHHFKNKTIVISGSSKGIGRTLAHTLGSMGANLVINGSDPAALQSTLLELQTLGYPAIGVRANVTDFRDCCEIADAAFQRFGSIDVVIANAGVTMEGSVEISSATAIKKVMDVNFLGTVFLIKACLFALKRSKGNILITGSASGFRGMPGAAAYTASKMALTALADALQIELTNTGINVSLAYVGFTKNDPTKRILSLEGEPVLKKNTLTVRVQSQEAVAHKMIRMLYRNQFKKTFSLLGRMNQLVSTYLPSLSTWILRKYYLKTVAG